MCELWALMRYPPHGSQRIVTHLAEGFAQQALVLLTLPDVTELYRAGRTLQDSQGSVVRLRPSRLASGYAASPAAYPFTRGWRPRVLGYAAHVTYEGVGRGRLFGIRRPGRSTAQAPAAD